MRCPNRGKPSICLPAIDTEGKPPSSEVCQVHPSTVNLVPPMTHTSRYWLIAARFSTLSALRLLGTPASKPAPTFHPMPRVSVLCARASYVLTPSERARLASELAPRRAFRASVLALPLRLTA